MSNSVVEILPVYRKCSKCNYTLVHEDYFLCLLEAGRSLDHLFSVLNFVVLAKSCCKDEYSNLKMTVIATRKSYLAGIERELAKLKTTDVDVRADAIYYLLMRGCGVRAACHLTKSPLLNVTAPQKGDCGECGNVIPNKNYVKMLLNERKNSIRDGGVVLKLTHYLHQYDIPRDCCMKSLESGKVKTDEFEGEPLLHDRGVPSENTDFILCVTCGTLISGCADDSVLPSLEVGAPLPPDRDHISGDSIRQAARWGLPTEIGFICHEVEHECCRRHIKEADVVIMASDAFDEKTKKQTFVRAVYIST